MDLVHGGTRLSSLVASSARHGLVGRLFAPRLLPTDSPARRDTDSEGFVIKRPRGILQGGQIRWYCHVPHPFFLLVRFFGRSWSGSSTLRLRGFFFVGF